MCPPRSNRTPPPNASDAAEGWRNATCPRAVVPVDPHAGGAWSGVASVVRTWLSVAMMASATLTATVACTGKPAVDDSAEAAPELALVDTNGARVSLADLSGQVVLVNVWATWCAPCIEEIPALVELHAAQSPRGFTVIGVNIDASKHDARVADFASEFSIPYPIWRDPESLSLQVLRGDGLPVSVLVDRRGKLRWKHVGLLDVRDPEFVAALQRALDEPQS